jgi:hypothetical protein
MLVKIFDGSLASGPDQLEEQINQWLGSLVEERAEVKRVSTSTYGSGPTQRLIVTLLYESPLEKNPAAT